ncbi:MULTISPECIES: hypothetical protein [Cyanophyceae]|uniref:hypothetical protein n=1 Tax=Cyanophyceae TaxID=3028117 RepID=UPI001686A76E|nr:hypothetical protein [Trichocoleus sp. FACHB-69]MBD1930500.1 hypothetical protein [Trichocoleus sp. FACHB-69]
MSLQNVRTTRYSTQLRTAIKEAIALTVHPLHPECAICLAAALALLDLTNIKMLK